MAVIKQFIKDIQPENNTKHIPIITHFKMIFLESIDEDIIKDSIFIKESNGSDLEYQYIYTGMNKTLILTPVKPLENSKRLELIIKGGKEGIKTIFDNTIEKDIVFFYETEEKDKSESIKQPQNIKVNVNGNFVSIEKEKDNSDAVSYKICNELTNPINVYPEVGELESKFNKFDVPKKLEIGIYYLYIRNLYYIKDKHVYSEYTTTSFEIKKEEETVNTFNINVVGSYPRNNEIIDNLDKFGFSFSEELAPVNLSDIQIYEKVNNVYMNNLFNSYIDITDLETVGDNIKFSIEKKDILKKGIAYTIKLRENIKSLKDHNLGEDNYFDFMIYPDRFYTTISAVRTLLGEFSTLFDDLMIMELIGDTSNSTYSRCERMTSFKAEEWEDNKAPYYVSEYVKFKVVYLLILNNILKTASGSGKDIKLADLEVSEKQMASSELKDLLKFLKLELDKWEDELENSVKAKFAKATSSSKSKNSEYKSEYPSFINRNPYRKLGGK